jgi:predicted membrane protein
LPDPQTSRLGRWLAKRRFQFALWIAVVEGVIVAISRDISWVVALIIAVPFILFYVLAGRTLESDAGRQLAWIAGASQTFVVLLAILFKIIGLLFIILIAILGVIAVMFLYSDRSDRPGRASKS